MAVTPNFGFGLIEQLSDLLRTYNGDIALIDTILNVLGNPPVGSGPVTVDEAEATFTGDTTGFDGSLNPATDFYYVYTHVDPATGLESAASSQILVTTPDEMYPPDAPTLTPATSGGALSPGQYYYVLSAYVGSNTYETSAFEVATTSLFPADGSDQKITLTLPALGDADGFNIYRKRPGMSSYYYIGSTAAGTFEDAGSGPEDCERFAPVTSNILSSYTITVEIDDLPVDYWWRIYRSNVSGDFSNALIGEVTNGDLTFVDLGETPSPRTPPPITPVLTRDVDGGVL